MIVFGRPATQQLSPVNSPFSWLISSYDCLTMVTEWGENHCSHLEDVGVRCSGPDMTRTCEATCGAGYFSLGQKCFDCPLDCKTCSSLKNCTSCFEERYLEGIE